MKDFRDLQVWQKAQAWRSTCTGGRAIFPREELYGLTSQLRRSAVSVAANLAEGCGRSGDGELARFCSIASGTASELEYYVLLARELNLMPPDDCAALMNRRQRSSACSAAFNRS